MYKGSKITKKKLLADYFSRITIKDKNKEDERKTLNKLLKLREYAQDKNSKYKQKNQFLNYFSKIKKKP